MRGLTIYQPWATDIAEGRKEHETRGHSPSYRGPLLIHAGKVKRYLDDIPFPDHHYPLGAVVAVANLADVHDTNLVCPHIEFGVFLLEASYHRAGESTRRLESGSVRLEADRRQAAQDTRPLARARGSVARPAGADRAHQGRGPGGLNEDLHLLNAVPDGCRAIWIARVLL